MQDRIKNDNINAILQLCEKKFEEEKNRENVVNTKALFLITVLSILISVLYNAIEFIYQKDNINKIFLFVLLIIMIIMIASLLFAVFSQCIIYRKGLPFMMDFKEALEKNGLTDENSTKKTLIMMYDEIIKDKHIKNNKIAKLLQIAFVILLITLTILMSIFLILMIKEAII